MLNVVREVNTEFQEWMRLQLSEWGQRRSGKDWTKGSGDS